MSLSPTMHRYHVALTTQATRVGTQLEVAWRQLDSWNEADIQTFLARTAAVVAGAQRATVATAAAFYARELGIAPLAVQAELVAAGIDLEMPFYAMWHALAEGRDFADAYDAGLSAVRAAGSDLVISTARLTGDAFAAKVDKQIQWQRVAEPGCCDWCAERDGGIYFSGDAADYGHDNCRCFVTPIET